MRINEQANEKGPQKDSGFFWKSKITTQRTQEKKKWLRNLRNEKAPRQNFTLHLLSFTNLGLPLSHNYSSTTHYNRL